MLRRFPPEEKRQEAVKVLQSKSEPDPYSFSLYSVLLRFSEAEPSVEGTLLVVGIKFAFGFFPGIAHRLVDV